MLNIVMLGLVGAGKGTQAKKLSNFLKIPHISTGDIFREAVRNRTSLGLKAEKIMAEGDLVPDKIVLGIVKERLNQPDVEIGYILDGFPRTLNQAYDFDNIQDIDTVFYITISEEEAIKRLHGRRVCGGCNAQYNIYLDSNIRDKCPKCGQSVKVRDDDKTDIVKIRIRNYTRQTVPLIDYYKKKSILKEIDGEKNIEKVFDEVKSFIDG